MIRTIRFAFYETLVIGMAYAAGIIGNEGIGRVLFVWLIMSLILHSLFLAAAMMAVVMATDEEGIKSVEGLLEKTDIDFVSSPPLLLMYHCGIVLLMAYAGLIWSSLLYFFVFSAKFLWHVSMQKAQENVKAFRTKQGEQL